jgi:hypothetical protein
MVRARFGPPVLAFLLQRLMLSLVAAASGFNPFASATWMRWDSAFYLGIAANGYGAVIHCGPETHYPKSAWCGTAGWFPGYPLLIRVLGGSPAAAVLLSAVCQLACLMLIWTLLQRGDATSVPDGRHWPALMLAAFFPGNVYLAAVFPISLVLLAMLGCLALCLSGRFALAAVAALVAAACYPTGVLLLPVVLAWALVHRRFRALLVPLGALLGYAAVLGLLWQQTGHWDAYFLIQRKYGFRLGLPFDALFARLKPLVNQRYRTALTFTTALQTLLSTALVVAALAMESRAAPAGGSPAPLPSAPLPATPLPATPLRAAPRPSAPTPAAPRLPAERTTLVLLCVAAFWLAPLVLGGNLSLYRAEALLLPAVLLVPAFPRRLQLSLLAAAVALSVPMAWLFFRSALV